MIAKFQATVVIVCAGEVDMSGDHITTMIHGKPQIVFPIVTSGDMPDTPEAAELVLKVIAHNVAGAGRKMLEVPGITTGVPMPVTDTNPGERS